MRGLGRSRNRLKSFIKEKNATLVAILEPFVEVAHMSLLGNFLNLHHFCSNEVEGGKLWIFWKELNSFEVMGRSSQTVTGWFVLADKRVLVTFVYAKCNYVERQDLWWVMEEVQRAAMACNG